ncbi:hypothetical protein [Actinoplanes sp. NPDC051411]|uniref:hypothetical protein n=1 Tax=Actinoplanes sp. NPDC051411 TaxID=3155522 RepID=UPI003441214A
MSVDELVTVTDRQWRKLGVGPGDRATLAADLRAELEAAAADGLDPAGLVGADVAGFARRVAEEAGVERTPPLYGPVLGVATAGAVLSLIVGYGVVIGLHDVFVAAFDLPRGTHVPIWLAAGIFYGGVAAVVIAGAAVGVRLVLRQTSRIRDTATRMSLLLPPALTAAILAAAGVGWALDFALTPAVIGAEGAIVLAGFLAATAAARHLSVTAKAGPPVPARS